MEEREEGKSRRAPEEGRCANSDKWWQIKAKQQGLVIT